jgi:eukaryotic-like serine/threonine-protein kinase
MIPERLSSALSGHYRLERELGQGGMATVYLAQDLKHDRAVAIKVLRPELAAVIGAERFLREIKTIATLQHSHILGLIDSGEVQGTAYYVMPFVEGESLRDRLNRDKQLPIPEAVRLATEVASALDYAHRHGTIHRDIKPENVLLHDGSALVADFGIALAVNAAGGHRLTETGLSLGTPHYMSPEQAMGEREITARSDVYALGAMTYEMLVGEPPFTGPTAQAIVAKVLSSEPARPTAARKLIPPHVEEAVLTALAKLPADRWGSAREFAEALAEGALRTGGSQTRPYTAQAALPARRPAAVVALIATALLAAAFLAGRTFGGKTTSSLPSRLAIFAPTVGGSGSSALARQVAITPAGDAVVYVGLNENSSNALFLQRLDAPEPVQIQGGTAVWAPDISRDGRWIIAGNLTMRIRLPLEGGTPRKLPPRVETLNSAWAPDGSFWYTGANVTGVERLGPSDSVIALDREKTRGLRVQQVLDDGRIALVVHAPVGTSSGPGMLLDLRSGNVTELLEGPIVELKYSAGQLLAVLPDGSLTATPFDPGRRRITGSSVQVATGVSLTGTGAAQIAVADNGTVAYIPESPRSLVFLDRTGAARQAIEERFNLHAPNFSPDGRRLSIDITSADGRDVWVLSLDQGTLSRATFDRNGHDATWTPDGRFLTYTSFRSGSVLGVYRVRPGSGAPAESLIASPHLAYTGIWLKDGSALITTANDLGDSTNSDIAIVRNGGHGPIEPLVATPFQELYAAPSPDGRWLAFVSDQSGRQEVYLRPLNGEGDLVQVSQDGGSEPAWAPDGRELYYRNAKEGQVDLMVATLKTAPTLAVLERRPLFPITEMVGTAPHANYSVSPDGRTFAMVRRSPATRIIVIQNLPELVRRIRGARGVAP